jgi:putative peptidoglycan lipid II flippase
MPVLIGSSAVQINVAFDRYFASMLNSGSTAAINYTMKVAMLPTMIVAASVATVTFPLIAGQFANSELAAIRRSVSLGLRMVGLVIIPSAAGLCVLAFPIVRTLFERGAFVPASTALCATLMPFACVQLLAISYGSILARACYACNEIPMAVVGSIASVMINVSLSAILLRSLGAGGLLLANGVGAFCYAIFLTVVLWRLIGGFEWKPLLLSTFRVSLASLTMAIALYVTRSIEVANNLISSNHAMDLGEMLVVGAIFFVGAAHMLRVEELSIAFTVLVKKVTKNAAGVPSRSSS